MTEERFNYLIAEAKPLIDSFNEFAEKYGLNHVELSLITTGLIDFTVYENVDADHFKTHSAQFENGTIKVSHKTFVREKTIDKEV